MYILVTYVDAQTGIPCTMAPMATGPKFPSVQGLDIKFGDQSQWPLSITDGIYDVAPHFYATCDDLADTSILGVLQVLTEAEYITAKQVEDNLVLVKKLSSYVQRRLDNFAASRNYDGILSACTYATSTVPKFAAEAQYCINARDATWAAMYAGLAEVQAGTRAMPTSYADIEGSLPPLIWPV